MKYLFLLSAVLLSVTGANAQKVGIKTNTPDSTLTVAGSAHITGNTLIGGPGNVKLDVVGTIKAANFQMTTGGGAGKVLMSDSFGNAKWAGCGLSIAQLYAGGMIFYLDASGCHGLVCTTSDQSTGIPWAASPVYTNTYANGVGAGEGNTAMVVYKQGAGSYAAQLCADLELNGYKDWYLPSKYELMLMYSNIGRGAPYEIFNIGGFPIGAEYWSSNEYEYNNIWAWYVDFQGGSYDRIDKVYVNRQVRAVRAF